jgi:hypothetical protein
LSYPAAKRQGQQPNTGYGQQERPVIYGIRQRLLVQTITGDGIRDRASGRVSIPAR